MDVDIPVMDVAGFDDVDFLLVREPCAHVNKNCRLVEEGSSSAKLWVDIHPHFFVERPMISCRAFPSMQKPNFRSLLGWGDCRSLGELGLMRRVPRAGPVDLVGPPSGGSFIVCRGALHVDGINKCWPKERFAGSRCWAAGLDGVLIQSL